MTAMRFGFAFTGVLPSSWTTVRGKVPSACRAPGRCADADDESADCAGPQPVRTAAGRAGASRGNRRGVRTNDSRELGQTYLTFPWRVSVRQARYISMAWA